MPTGFRAGGEISLLNALSHTKTPLKAPSCTALSFRVLSDVLKPQPLNEPKFLSDTGRGGLEPQTNLLLEAHANSS